MSKSVFASKTFWAIALTAIAAIAPPIGEAIEKGEMKPTTIAQILVIGCTSTAGVLARLYAKESVHTPKGWLGPDREG